MLEYRTLKEKHWCGIWLRVYQNPTGAFLVVREDDDGNILGASFHWFWNDALREFNNEKARLQKESTSK